MPTPRSIRAPRVDGNATFRIVARGRRSSPHEDVYHFLLVRSWSVFLSFGAGLYLAICLLFALLYLAVPGSVGGMRRGSLEDAFYFSVHTMSTIGYGTLVPGNRWAHVLVIVQALSNILLVALFTGLTFAKFARPRARVLFTDKVVVGPRDGVPHLMVRLANWRHNQVIEAQLRMYMIVVERTREGEVLRRPVELTLVRDRTPIFMLTFMAMHRIDGSSPLASEAQRERLMADGVDLIVAFTGLDETLGHQIHARHRYSMNDIVWGARFVDIITTTSDGTREIDYAHFHDVVPAELPATVSAVAS
jgi:inward rectifier potassium channel